MKDGTRNGLLVGAGFLLGTIGIKALTSPAARRCYVQGVAYGLRARDSYSSIVEEAKAQVDDIVAEAGYLNDAQSSERRECEASSKGAAGAVSESKK